MKDYGMNSIFNALKKKRQDREEMKIQQIMSHVAGIKEASSQSSTQVSLGVQILIKYWHIMFLERSTKFPLSLEISIFL